MMIALVIIILALALAPAVAEFTNTARDGTTGMDCDDSTNSNFIKAACVATDLTLFYYIAAVLFIGIALIGARVVFGEQ